MPSGLAVRSLTPSPRPSPVVLVSSCANVQLELPFLGPSPPVPRLPPLAPQEDRVEFVRVRRARRYILRVRPDGVVRVTVPRGGSRREAQTFLEAQRRWIERERARTLAEHAPAAWGDGTVILFRGHPVRISVAIQGHRCIAAYGDRTLRLGDGLTVRDAIQGDLRALAREELVPRVHELAAVHRLDVARVTIRGQRSRWGSCSRAGVVALNFRLLQAPPEVRDYVIVHELMHLRQQNHSRRFWRLVEAACPSFRDAERWLKTRGKALF